MENLSADDLVAEIDISEREVSPGPYNLPVKITARAKGWFGRRANIPQW